MPHQEAPQKAANRYIERPKGASTPVVENHAALVDRLFQGLRDDPTTRAGAVRLLASFEAEEDLAAARANNTVCTCPQCGHEFAHPAAEGGSH